MAAGLAVAHALAALLAARPAPAAAEAWAPRPPERRPGQGRVVSATPTRAYLDAGADDGLEVGSTLQLRRGDAPAGTCRVEEVAAHHAACAGIGLRAGDTFAYAPRLAEAPGPAPAPPLDPAESARRAALAAEAPVPQVEFRPGPGAAQGERRSAAAIGLEDATWASDGSQVVHVDAVDVAIQRAEVARGLYLDVDARAEYWWPRGSPVFRPDARARLYVWQAQLTYEPDDRPWSLAAGRILPWVIPGASIFDGASAAWRPRSSVEVGVFGGAVPEPNTTAPTLQRSTGGGYWVLSWPGADVLFRQEGRLAMVHTPELGTRGELEARASAAVGRWLDASATAQFGAGGTEHAPGYLDGARVDLGLRPAPRVTLSGSFAYAGLDIPQTFYPPAFAGRNRRAEAFAGYDLGRLVRIGVVGGLARDLGSGDERRWVGPELWFPRIVLAWLSGSAGYLEESGWLEGRSAYGQLVLRPWEQVSLLARVSWSHERALGLDQDELAGYVAATAVLSPWLGLRLALAARGPISDGTTGAGGLAATLSLTGTR